MVRDPREAVGRAGQRTHHDMGCPFRSHHERDHAGWGDLAAFVCVVEQAKAEILAALDERLARIDARLAAS